MYFSSHFQLDLLRLGNIGFLIYIAHVEPCSDFLIIIIMIIIIENFEYIWQYIFTYVIRKSNANSYQNYLWCEDHVFAAYHIIFCFCFLFLLFGNTRNYFDNFFIKKLHATTAYFPLICILLLVKFLIKSIIYKINKKLAIKSRNKWIFT